jgi:hypothetical protein
MTYQEKTEQLKQMYSQQLELRKNISALQHELAFDGAPIRQLFVDKVNLIVEMLQNIDGYETTFYHEEKTSIYNSKTMILNFFIKKKKTVGPYAYRQDLHWNSSFTRKTPTTEKLINTKFKQLEKLIEQFAKREPEFKQQYERKKLAQKLKEI